MGRDGLRNPDEGPRIPEDEGGTCGPLEAEGWLGGVLLAGEADTDLGVCFDAELENEDEEDVEDELKSEDAENVEDDEDDDEELNKDDVKEEDE